MVTMTLAHNPISTETSGAPVAVEDRQALAVESRAEMTAKHMPLVRYETGRRPPRRGLSMRDIAEEVTSRRRAFRNSTTVH